MADKTKGLVDYLMADPSLTAAQKIDVIVRLVEKEMVDAKRVGEILYGVEPKSGLNPNTISANVIKCGCVPKNA